MAVVIPEVTVAPKVVVTTEVLIVLGPSDRWRIEEQSFPAFGEKVRKSPTANWIVGLLHDTWHVFA